VPDLRGVEILTFDCYGTLIDWETGILTALRPVLERVGVGSDDQALLELFGRLESTVQKEPFRPYRRVLAEVLRRMGGELGFLPTESEAGSFGASVAEWPAFPDSVEALAHLASRYRLAVMSNVDDDLFRASAARLGDPFGEVVTAEQVRSYKPARAHFDEMLRRLGTPLDRVLHVAQSLYHDVAPARALGFACVWVNRRIGKGGTGATPAAQATPDLEVPDLATLVRHLWKGGETEPTSA
jgi:2-haloacid dehalogenase